VLCRTKQKGVVEREACKRKQVAVDLAAVGAGGREGDTGPRGTSYVRVVAVDANGVIIGVVTAESNVLMQQDTRVISVGVTDQGFVPAGSLYYQSTDCSGQAFVFGDGALAEAARLIGTPVAYYSGRPLATRNSESQLRYSTPQSCMELAQTYDPVARTCCTTSSTTLVAGPAVTLDLSGFTPPFRLEIQR
jgi:hypothetical protein